MAACDFGTTEPAAPHEPRLLLHELVVAPAGRPVVAEVNGVPVYADCVKRQAEAHQLPHQEALGECIDFELLAQAADQPQYLGLVEVQEEGKQELVRKFIQAEYPVRTPADLPMALVRELWKQVSPRRYNRPELRDMVFCRMSLDENPGAQSEQSKQAEHFLRAIYDQLKSQKHLKKNDLFAACFGDPDPESTLPRPWKEAGVPEPKLRTFSPSPRSRYQEAFRATIFDGPEKAGMVTPPLLTEHGWDLILITLVLPEIQTDFAEAEAELRKALFEEPIYEERRQLLFERWYSPFEKRHQISRSYDKLPAAGPALSLQPSPRGAPP